MKIINTGNVYDIFPDDLRSYDLLPAGYYRICYSEQRGFFLEKYGEFSIGDGKIYGQHIEKVDKVLDAFSQFNRSLGVILSGDKGIGKSLFSRCLGREMVKHGTPVIIVEKYISGIASFIEKIDQEVMILFDEFDKTFGKLRGDGEVSDPQTYMLSLFDGIANGKKLFVITCNDVYKLNDFLVNRPGRFHYHFRFGYPGEREIKTYLTDNLKKEVCGEIANVISFSRKVNLNYDCLRAIAFELNRGVEFKEAISDLNIINIKEEEYKIDVRFKDGTVISNSGEYINLFGEEKINVSLYDDAGRRCCDMMFSPRDVRYDSKFKELRVNPDKVKIDPYRYYFDDEDDEEDEKMKKFREKKIESISIARIKPEILHYAV